MVMTSSLKIPTLNVCTLFLYFLGNQTRKLLNLGQRKETARRYSRCPGSTKLAKKKKIEKTGKVERNDRKNAHRGNEVRKGGDN